VQNYEEYLRLIYTGHERRDVDYKRDMPWDKATKYRIIKDILSFANYGGGYLVIGVAERDEGLGFDFTGVCSDNQKSWEVTAVSQSVNEYAEPAIDVSVVPITDDKKQVCFVLLVIPSHGTTPHICKRDKNDHSGVLLLRKCALYYRTSNKSCEEISNVTDFRSLIRRCSVNDRAEILRDFYQIVIGVSKPTSETPRRGYDPLQMMDAFSREAQKYQPNGLENVESDE